VLPVWAEDQYPTATPRRFTEVACCFLVRWRESRSPTSVRRAGRGRQRPSERKARTAPGPPTPPLSGRAGGRSSRLRNGFVSSSSVAIGSMRAGTRHRAVRCAFCVACRRTRCRVGRSVVVLVVSRCCGRACSGAPVPRRSRHELRRYGEEVLCAFARLVARRPDVVGLPVEDEVSSAELVDRAQDLEPHFHWFDSTRPGRGFESLWSWNHLGQSLHRTTPPVTIRFSCWQVVVSFMSLSNHIHRNVSTPKPKNLWEM
jgi:hypothetical protein